MSDTNKRSVNWPALICIVMLGALNVSSLVINAKQRAVIDKQRAVMDAGTDALNSCTAIIRSTDALASESGTDDIAAAGAGLKPLGKAILPRHGQRVVFPHEVIVEVRGVFTTDRGYPWFEGKVEGGIEGATVGINGDYLQVWWPDESEVDTDVEQIVGPVYELEPYDDGRSLCYRGDPMQAARMGVADCDTPPPAELESGVIDWTTDVATITGTVASDIATSVPNSTTLRPDLDSTTLKERP